MNQKGRSNFKVIYHWSDAGIVAQLAAAIHLGFIAKKGGLTVTKIKNLPFGGGFTGRNKGSLFFLGRAKKGEEVYLLPRGKNPDLIIKTIRKFACLFGDDPINYYFVNCDDCLESNRPSRISKNHLFELVSRTVIQIEGELGE